jgi:hypothetical protein
VIWADRGVDVTTGQPYKLQNQNCGGLTWPMGTGQTYSEFQVESIGNTRNIFKHEWGHAILSYYDAAGTAPKPAVNNHINGRDIQYVNCQTGYTYILDDETPVNPVIINSIYNNYVGFTHDYYSGKTALPGTTACLGITASAWASGGPVSRPGHQMVIRPPGEAVGPPHPMVGRVEPRVIQPMSVESPQGSNR